MLDKKLEAFVNVMLDLKPTLLILVLVTAPDTPIALFPAGLGAGSPAGKLPTLARQGFWFVGDPGMRRVYVHYVAGIKDPVLREGMQNDIGLMDSKHQRLLRGMGFTDDEGATLNSYNRNRCRLDFMGTDGFCGDWFDIVNAEDEFEDDLAGAFVFRGTICTKFVQSNVE